MEYGQNIFTAMIDESGTIWEAGTGRKRQAVGIDVQKEQDYQQTISQMQERLDEYYAKLVELGVITPPKTPEQLAQEAAAEQSMINQKLLEAINGLHAEIKELKKNGDAGSGNGACEQSGGQNSTSNRQVAARSKSSNGKGKATPS